MRGETRVKICGLRRQEDVEQAVACGADYIGFIFDAGPRAVDRDDLARWLDDVRDPAEVVGVFRNSPFDDVVETVARFDLDFVQLHGREEGQQWHRLPVRLIEARIVEDDRVPPARFAGAAWAEVLDAGAGSGNAFDWTLAVAPSRARRTFLAGGLTPDNVARAIELVRPFAVDTSSGVEDSPGVKNHQRIQAFVDAARSRS